MNRDIIYKIVRDEVSEICDVSSNQIEGSTDLFDLGFHSLLVTQLVSRLRNRFDTPLALSDFFISPCIDGIVDMIELKLTESYE
jgi:acyl carrier protein